MKKSKKKSSNSFPFQLESKIEFYHRWYFIQYINELAPEVSVECKKLTKDCKELFGDFPQSLINFNSLEDSNKIWVEINLIISKCVWTESELHEDFIEWSQVLGNNDERFKSAYDAIDEFHKDIRNKAKKFSDEKYNEIKTKILNSADLSPNEINLADKESFILQFITQDHLENNEIYAENFEIKQAKFNKLREFQKKFDELLTRFCLRKHWLADIVFRAIWDGTGILRMYQGYFESFDANLLTDIEDKLGRQKEVEEEYQTILRFSGRIPLPNSFIYNEHLSEFDSFEDYEQKAIDAYRQSVREFLNIVRHSLKEHGYKEFGRPYDYSLIEWLVRFSVQKWSVLDIAPTYHTTQRNVYIHFKNFAKYDLPVCYRRNVK